MNEEVIDRIRTLSQNGYKIKRIELELQRQDESLHGAAPAAVADIIDKMRDWSCKPCMVNGAPGICCEWKF